MVCIKKEEVKNKYKERGYEIELSNQLEEIIKTPVDVIVLNRTSDFVLHRVSKGILIKNSNDDHVESRNYFVKKFHLNLW